MALVLPNPTLGTGVIDPTPLEENFNEIAQKFGSITTADLSSSAGITTTQLAASKQAMVIPLRVWGSVADLTSTGFRKESMTAVYDDGYGAWTIDKIAWSCSDVGAGSGAFKIAIGATDGAGSFTVNTYLSDAIVLSTAYGTAVPLTTLLPNTTTKTAIGIYISTADGTAVDSGDYLAATLHLSRTIRG